jgi:hypothetical protein
VDGCANAVRRIGDAVQSPLTSSLRNSRDRRSMT